MCMSLELISKK